MIRYRSPHPSATDLCARRWRGTLALCYHPPRVDLGCGATVMGHLFRQVTKLAFLFLMLGPSASFATDGVILIDQSKALAGNVTPGDAAGFPVTISRRGSYRLSGALVAPA